MCCTWTNSHILLYDSLYFLVFSAGENVDSSVPSEPRWKTERREHYSYRPDTLAADPKKQSSIAVGWLTSDINDIQENFELSVHEENAHHPQPIKCTIGLMFSIFFLQIITELLVKGPNSPFYHTLVEPNIGAGLHPITGFTSQTRDTIFAVGLQGMDSADFDKVVSIIEKTVRHQLIFDLGLSFSFVIFFIN